MYVFLKKSEGLAMLILIQLEGVRGSSPEIGCRLIRHLVFCPCPSLSSNSCSEGNTLTPAQRVPCGNTLLFSKDDKIQPFPRCLS